MGLVSAENRTQYWFKGWAIVIGFSFLSSSVASHLRRQSYVAQYDITHRNHIREQSDLNRSVPRQQFHSASAPNNICAQLSELLWRPGEQDMWRHSENPNTEWPEKWASKISGIEKYLGGIRKSIPADKNPSCKILWEVEAPNFHGEVSGSSTRRSDFPNNVTRPDVQPMCPADVGVDMCDRWTVGSEGRSFPRGRQFYVWVSFWVWIFFSQNFNLSSGIHGHQRRLIWSTVCGQA